MEIQIYNPADLQPLPDILKQNQLSKSNAKSAVEKFLSALPKDLTSVDPVIMESHDVLLNDFQAKLSVTVETMEFRRKPFTATFDKIRTAFTTEEKEVTALLDQLKEIRNNWNKEKVRRQVLAQQKTDEELNRLREFVDINTQIKKTIYERFLNAVSKIIAELYNQFNEETLEFLPVFEINLRKYEPVLSDARYFTLFDAFPVPVSRYYTNIEILALSHAQRDEMRAQLSSEWVEKLTAEKNKILELIPSRKNNIEVQAKAEVTNTAAIMQSIDNQAEVEKLNATFDAAATATPVVGITKGTVVKKKYNAATHKAYVAIVQFWVTSKMNKLTIEELSKKLSFMVTAANEDLNKGVALEADGLTVEDDYTTRSTRKKTA